MKQALRLLALLLALSACLACGRRGESETGVVARVNGRPITLEQLEFQYDLLHFDAQSGALPTVGALREAYGTILGSLVAQELVAQELERRGLDVTDAEVAEAEAKIRADYPDDTFDQMLTDEFVDVRQWRRQLRYARAVEKFQQLVLRPQVRIDYREAEAYYREHIADFRLPERMRLLVVRAPAREVVEKALAQVRTQKNVKALAEAFPQAQVREAVVRKDLLSVAWADALHGVEPGGAGAVLSDRYGFEGVVYLERIPAQVLDPTQAYPQIEAALVEQKLQATFDAWLGKAVDAAVILVSQPLVHKRDDEDLPPEEPARENENPPVASGNETR